VTHLAGRAARLLLAVILPCCACAKAAMIDDLAAEGRPARDSTHGSSTEQAARAQPGGIAASIICQGCQKRLAVHVYACSACCMAWIATEAQDSAYSTETTVSVGPIQACLLMWLRVSRPEKGFLLTANKLSASSLSKTGCNAPLQALARIVQRPHNN
jgi:hypothetical protein